MNTNKRVMKRVRWTVMLGLVAGMAMAATACDDDVDSEPVPTDMTTADADATTSPDTSTADTSTPEDTSEPGDTATPDTTDVVEPDTTDTVEVDTVEPDTTDTVEPDTMDTVEPDTTDTMDTMMSGGEVGDGCAAATDCSAADSLCWTDGFPAGYCTYSCANGETCPAGTVCQAFQDDSAYCLVECTANSDCRDGYICDEYQQCWPGEPACTQDSDCGTGLYCSDGTCLLDIGTPPAGSPPASCPDAVDWACTGTPAECATVEQFLPVVGEGWWNYPLNGETDANQYRSYLRRDTTQLVKYATSMVACVAASWPGNGGLLGLGDMSEANGDIPGTAVGSPGHPQGTHVDGYDIDIAYYQVATPDNKLRAVCDHISGGADQYHCVDEPDTLDVWRTALFIAYLHDAVLHNTFQTRVIGVDGRVGPLIESAIDQLCQAGWYDGYACDYSLLAYETTDMGYGWYHFHHHHLHLSINGLHPDVMPSLKPNLCLRPGCATIDPALDPRRGLEVAGRARQLAPRALPGLRP